MIDTERMAEYTKWLVWVGAGIGLLQIVLLFLQSLYTGKAANAAKASADHIAVTEGAYIGINDGEGAIFRRFAPDRFNVSFLFGAANKGKTPAQVTDAVVTMAMLPKGVPLPATPEYREHVERPAAFLVTDALITVGWNTDLTKAQREAIDDGSLVLYAFGYVDYIDKFTMRHRTGFGREYGPEIDKLRNAGQINRDAINLSVVPNQQYNYDRTREKGEGKDWD